MDISSKKTLLEVVPHGVTDGRMEIRPTVPVSATVHLIFEMDDRGVSVDSISNYSDDPGWGSAMILFLKEYEDQTTGRSPVLRRWSVGGIKESSYGFWLYVQSAFGVVVVDDSGRVLPSWQNILEWKQDSNDEYRMHHGLEKV